MSNGHTVGTKMLLKSITRYHDYSRLGQDSSDLPLNALWMEVKSNNKNVRSV